MRFVASRSLQLLLFLCSLAVTTAAMVEERLPSPDRLSEHESRLKQLGDISLGSCNIPALLHREMDTRDNDVVQRIGNTGEVPRVKGFGQEGKSVAKFQIDKSHILTFLFPGRVSRQIIDIGSTPLAFERAVANTITVTKYLTSTVHQNPTMTITKTPGTTVTKTNTIYRTKTKTKTVQFINGTAARTEYSAATTAPESGNGGWSTRGRVIRGTGLMGMAMAAMVLVHV